LFFKTLSPTARMLQSSFLKPLYQLILRDQLELEAAPSISARRRFGVMLTIANRSWAHAAGI